MKLAVLVRRLETPQRVEVEHTPHWLSRVLAAITGGLLGRRSFTRFAAPIQPGSAVWCWDDTGRAVDDETYAAIVDAVTDAQLRARLRMIHESLCVARERWRQLLDERLN